MLKIGLTGGIASGKSTVSTLFESLKVPVIDTDHISKKLMQPGETAFQQTIKQFGQSILNSDGTLNRSQLRERVFNNMASKKWLENLLHPLIRNTVFEQLEQIDNQDYALIVVPLLVEAGYNTVMNKIIVIHCSREQQFNRLIHRDNVTADLANKMLDVQVSNDERLKHADWIIDNDSETNGIYIDELLMPQVEKIHHEILQLSRKTAPSS